MQLKLNFLFVESGEEILRKQKIWETQESNEGCDLSALGAKKG